MNIEELLEKVPKKVADKIRNQLEKIDQKCEEISNKFIQPITDEEELLITIAAIQKLAYHVTETFKEIFFDPKKIREHSNEVH